MSEEKRVSDAQKRAHRKYMSGFVEIKVRMTPEKRKVIQEHASAMAESATVFINRAIDQTMSQDAAGGPQSAAAPLTSIISYDTLETAQTAAEAAGEAVPVFIHRAVSGPAERDRMTREGD